MSETVQLTQWVVVSMEAQGHASQLLYARNPEALTGKPNGRWTMERRLAWHFTNAEAERLIGMGMWPGRNLRIEALK